MRMPNRVDTIRRGGRRLAIGGHQGKRCSSIDECWHRRRFLILKKIVKEEAEQEVLSNWRTMQSRVTVPPRYSDEPAQTPVWEDQPSHQILDWEEEYWRDIDLNQF